MFNKDYPYKSSESFTMKNSFHNLSKKIKKVSSQKILSGSNDGAFLKF